MPVIKHWTELQKLDYTDPRAQNTCFENPECRYKSYSCSKQMSTEDCCFYHQWMIGQKHYVKCDCAQAEPWLYFLKSECDVEATIFHLGLYTKRENMCIPLELPAPDEVLEFKCCHNNVGKSEFKCGPIMVCRDCRHKHIHTFKTKLYHEQPDPIEITKNFPVFSLVKRLDCYGMMTCPNNPECKIASDSCSVAMAPTAAQGGDGHRQDVCFWHYYRMGSKKDYACGCKKWPVVDGDSPGRHLALSYYNLDYDTTPVIDSAGILYCCGLACNYGASGKRKCGQMRVCDGCTKLHARVTVEKKRKIMWEQTNAYQTAISKRMTTDQFWMYAAMTPTGPQFTLRNEVTGSLTVCSAATALIAAGSNPATESADWWVWIAGWYKDCPMGITRHF